MHPPIKVPPVGDAPQSIVDAGSGPVEIYELILDTVTDAETKSICVVQGHNTLLDRQSNGKLVVRRNLHVYI